MHAQTTFDLIRRETGPVAWRGASAAGASGRGTARHRYGHRTRLRHPREARSPMPGRRPAMTFRHTVRATGGHRRLRRRLRRRPGRADAPRAGRSRPAVVAPRALTAVRPGPRTGSPLGPGIADCAVRQVPRAHARPDAGTVGVVMLRHQPRTRPGAWAACSSTPAAPAGQACASPIGRRTTCRPRSPRGTT